MDITEIYESKVFSDSIMRARLPEKVYRSLKETSRMGKPLDHEIADVVAATMKDWAISQGATHYSHWFQPLSGRTAGKHDSFINPGQFFGEQGKVVSEFSSSALVQGEPDASSFPSGGLRAVFEARGYTVWDPTSPAFVRDGTLFIPTAFSAYTGEALDEKTPLLRSMRVLAPQALRIMRACGHVEARAVVATTGAEQEYFLVDRRLYEQRLDLRLCGRALFGRKPVKGQELEDHYCGRLKMRVSGFMRELDEELWRLGVPSKTKHNEVAPGQHELAPVYETDNIACDHNLLTMDVMRATAKKHGLACLLHEKPFEGVNGSGKHNNFSLMSDDGVNFLKPGKHPEENKLFLLTLCAILEAVDSHADLLRLSAASAGNDCRLGGNEAPPAIISVFLGDALSGILNGIAYNMSPEVRRRAEINDDLPVLPSLVRDNSDRNRTSPFAFTGNKFEFRMPGASQSVAFCNVVINTALADVFSRFADRLESCGDVEREVAGIVADTIKNHGRIIFNGNNYAAEWQKEAERRGLYTAPNSLSAYDCIVLPENIKFFTKNGVLNETECRARYEILLDVFIKTVALEAEVMLEMARRQLLPACAEYIGRLAGSFSALDGAGISQNSMREALETLSGSYDLAVAACKALDEVCAFNAAGLSLRDHAAKMQEDVRPAMEKLRAACDALEGMTPVSAWPVPGPDELLHSM